MNLKAVVEKFLPSNSKPSSTSTKGTTMLTSPGGSKVALALMIPVLPMLVGNTFFYVFLLIGLPCVDKIQIATLSIFSTFKAEACKSVDMAMKKCSNGMFAEIKYDGERVQVHKRGNEFRYFSRSLKPVMAHKVCR